MRRDEGVLPPDKEMAEFYEEQAKDRATLLDRSLQRKLIEEMIVACQHQRLRLHAGTTELSHFMGSSAGEKSGDGLRFAMV